MLIDLHALPMNNSITQHNAPHRKCLRKKTTACVRLLVFFRIWRGTFPYSSVEDNASTISQIPTTHCTNNTCVKLTIVTHLSFSERIAIARYPCTDARPTKTCIAPVDASGFFIIIIFLRTSSVGGGGGGYTAKPFLLFFFPCSANHERDWLLCKVVFRVGNQYAECEKQQQ